MNLVLIGGRGVGKTSTASILASLTGRTSLSLDLLISLDYGGRSIQDLLKDCRGDWRFFREMEYQVVRKVSQMDQIILDCGGGVVVDLDPAGTECQSHRKIALLKERGWVVWLRGDPHRVAQRLARQAGTDTNRPVLDPAQTEAAIMARRRPFYQSAADLIVDVEDLPPRGVAHHILKHFASLPGSGYLP